MEQIGIITWTDKATAIAAMLTFVVLFLTFVVLLIAAFYGKHQLRLMERSREAQLLADFSRRWVEEPLVEARRAVKTYKDGCELRYALEYLEKKNHEQYYVLLKVADFYEDLELLIKSRCITLELVKDMFGDAIKRYYTLYEPSIKYMREKYDTLSIYDNFEELAKKVNN